MRCSLSMIFVSLALVLLFSGGVHGIPVNGRNGIFYPNGASSPHAEVHKRDLLSGVLDGVLNILGALGFSVSNASEAEALVGQLHDVTGSLPIPLPPSTPVSLPPLAAVEIADGGSSSSSTPISPSQASMASASSHKSSASSAATSTSVGHLQGDMRPIHGRYFYRRQTAPASAASSGSSPASASGTRAPAAVTVPVPTLVTSLVPTLPVSAPTVPAIIPSTTVVHGPRRIWHAHSPETFRGLRTRRNVYHK